MGKETFSLKVLHLHETKRINWTKETEHMHTTLFTYTAEALPWEREILSFIPVLSPVAVFQFK